jgi:predicted DNA-binding mobile mystery protein A
MSSRELAGRMGIAQSTEAALEASEMQGTIGLESLQRAAEALDCELVYFLVPRRSLSESVEDRARQVAAEHLAAIRHHSRLEDQALDGAGDADELEALAADLVDQRGLWNEPL